MRIACTQQRQHKQVSAKAYCLVPEVTLNPGLGVSPGQEGIHEVHIGLHRSSASRCNLCDPDGFAKLLVQAGGPTHNGAQVLGIGVVAQSMDGIPSTRCVGV